MPSVLDTFVLILNKLTLKFNFCKLYSLKSDRCEKRENDVGEKNLSDCCFLIRYNTWDVRHVTSKFNIWLFNMIKRKKTTIILISHSRLYQIWTPEHATSHRGIAFLLCALKTTWSPGVLQACQATEPIRGTVG